MVTQFDAAVVTQLAADVTQFAAAVVTQFAAVVTQFAVVDGAATCLTPLYP